MSSPRPTWSRSCPGGRSCGARPARASRAAARSTRRRRRRSRSTRSRSSTTASAAARAATSSRSSARPRTSTSSAPSSGSRSGFASRSRSRRHRRRSRQARRRRERLYARARADDRVLRAAPLGRGRGAPVASISQERGLGEEIAKEFRLGLSPGQGLADKAREQGFTLDELEVGGLVTTRGTRLLPATPHVSARRRARPRGRLPGAQASRGRPAARAST